MAPMLEDLSPYERLLLLRYLCAFAWTDLVVQESEKRFVRRILEKAALDATDAAEVEGWLEVAPSPSSVDIRQIARPKRRIFFDAARALMYADGDVDPEERATLEKLRAALDTD